MPNPKISTDWTKHLKDQKEKKEFESVVRSSSFLLSRLRDLLSEYEREIDLSETKLDVYDSPSWSHKQAHQNGRRQAYRKIKELLGNDQY